MSARPQSRATKDLVDNNNKNTNPADKLPTVVVWVITLLAAGAAVGEALGQWFRAIRASKMRLRAKLAHGVAAVWVTLSRARSGWRSINTPR